MRYNGATACKFVMIIDMQYNVLCLKKASRSGWEELLALVTIHWKSEFCVKYSPVYQLLSTSLNWCIYLGKIYLSLCGMPNDRWRLSHAPVIESMFWISTWTRLGNMKDNCSFINYYMLLDVNGLDVDQAPDRFGEVQRVAQYCRMV